MSDDRRWYALGRFQILAKPLDTNPYWMTHHIYLKGRLVGRQLSVPCESDCEWYVRAHVASPERPKARWSIRRAGPGRPRNAWTEWLEGLAA